MEELMSDRKAIGARDDGGGDRSPATFRARMVSVGSSSPAIDPAPPEVQLHVEARVTTSPPAAPSHTPSNLQRKTSLDKILAGSSAEEVPVTTDRSSHSHSGTSPQHDPGLGVSL